MILMIATHHETGGKSDAEMVMTIAADFNNCIEDDNDASHDDDDDDDE